MSGAAAAIERGMAHHQAGRLREAGAAYREALGHQPDHTDALHLLGLVTHLRGDSDGAIAMIERAIAGSPRNAVYWGNITEVYRAAQRIDDSLAAGLRATELAPRSFEAQFNLALAFKEIGRVDEAIPAFRRALTIKPDCAEAYYEMYDLKRFSAGDADIAEMQRLIGDPAISPDNAMYLGFALGKAHEDSGDDDAAFSAWLRANRRRRRKGGFDALQDAALIDRLIDIYDADLIERLSGAGHESETPVFIVGMPRSGTSLVEQILASHPAVHGAGELKHVSHIARFLQHEVEPPAPYPECVRETDTTHWHKLGAHYLERLSASAAAPNATRITDKMMANFRYVGFIHLMLPNARIIHCRRDALDTCLSCYKTCFTDGQEFSYDMTELGLYYRHYDRLMAHWNAVLPGRMLDVAYEDVVGDVDAQARRLVDFCGLPWDDACLDFHRTERPVRTASAAQVRRPIYDSSVARWRRFERHLGPLIETLGRLAKT